jgi:hypothetical protein
MELGTAESVKVSSNQEEPRKLINISFALNLSSAVITGISDILWNVFDLYIIYLYQSDCHNGGEGD